MGWTYNKEKKIYKQSDTWVEKHVYKGGPGDYRIYCIGLDEATADAKIKKLKDISINGNYKKVGDKCDKKEDFTCGGADNRISQCVCNDDAVCESKLYKKEIFCELPLEEAREETFVQPVQLQNLLDIENGKNNNGKKQRVPIRVGEPCGRDYKCGPTGTFEIKHGIKIDTKSKPFKYQSGLHHERGENVCQCKIKLDESTECITTTPKKHGDLCIHVERVKFHPDDQQPDFAQNRKLVIEHEAKHQKSKEEIMKKKPMPNPNKLKKYHTVPNLSPDRAESGHYNVYDGYDYDDNTGMQGYQYESDYLWFQMEKALIVIMVVGVCTVCCVVWGCIVAFAFIYSRRKFQPQTISNQTEDGVLQI